jgi:hypothetical protein
VTADGTPDRLLERFTADVRTGTPLVALWAHGSLALGDYRHGRSDLDLIAVLDGPPDRERLLALHRQLAADEPGAARLHCSYLPADSLADSGLPHLTWAHGGLLERPVTAVTRRELLDGGRVLHGPSPEVLLPPLAAGQLEEHILRDLREYWYPATARPVRWLRDPWVDLGLLVLARATVTLRDGRMITKREALAELSDLGAPADVVRDIHHRRYAEAPGRTGPLHRLRRGLRARAFLREGIARTLAAHGRRV